MAGITERNLEEAEASGSRSPHRMRITGGGSIQSYVRFALSHLENHPQQPLVLHTIPPVSSPPVAGEPRAAGSTDKATSDEASSSERPEAAPQDGKRSSRSTLHPCTLTTPRLISVVEIIKREYISSLEAKGKGKGKHRATGLWQYTETSLLANEPRDVAEEDDGAVLRRVLEGRTKPKMTHRPYLQITLSTRPLGLEKKGNVSCQYVLVRRSRKGKKGKPKRKQADQTATKEDVVGGNPVDTASLKKKAKKDGEKPSMNRAKRKAAGSSSSQNGDAAAEVSKKRRRKGAAGASASSG